MKWFLDTETTGLAGPAVEIALVPEHGDGWSTLINQQVPIEPAAAAVNHITDEECRRFGLSEEGVAKVLGANLKDGDEVWAHNVNFDRVRVEGIFARAGVAMPKIVWRCTLEWSRKVLPGPHRLAALAEKLGLRVGGHRAKGDAMCCRDLYFSLTKTVDLNKPKPDYLKVDGCRIVWGTYYTGWDGIKKYKEFEVRAVDFQTKRFQVIDIRINEAREYCFSRFNNPLIADAIIKVMA